jgi:hypothetical protein
MELNVANAGGVGVFAHAPHPNTGLLLMNFLISPEGPKNAGFSGPSIAFGNPTFPNSIWVDNAPDVSVFNQTPRLIWCALHHAIDRTSETRYAGNLEGAYQ